MNFNDVFSGPDAALCGFVCRFLADRGALFEKRGQGVTLLLPGDLAELIDAGEHMFISTQSSRERENEDHYYPVHFGAALVQRVLSLAGSHPAVATCSLKFHYLKKSGFDQLINEQFSFVRSNGRVSQTANIETRYLLLTFKYLAQSDEQKEGLVSIALNDESGAHIPDLEPMLAHQEKVFSDKTPSSFEKSRVDRLLKIAEPYVSEAVAAKTGNFRKSMNRRFIRDTASLEDYYKALSDEMIRSLERGGLSPQGLADREEKIRQIPLELAAKKKDLLNKYGIKLRVNLSAVLWVYTPVVRIHFQVRSGHVQKTLSMSYNPITKSMDPLVCESCGKSIYRIDFCKSMHLVCSECRDKACQRCGEGARN